MRTVSILATVLVLVMVGASFGVVIGNASAAESTRDSFGYWWTDSKAPSPSVAFNWVEINSTGTNSGVTGNDVSGGPFPIGFTFDFYENNYSQFYIQTNGMITFGAASTSSWNDYIPDSWSPNNFIAPYWYDLVTGTGTIYYETTGSAPLRQLVVEYENVTERWYSNMMTFEIILNETGDIWFQYLTLGGYDGYYASVGIENSGGTIGVQYSRYSYALADNLAVRFSQGLVSIGPTQAKTDRPGNTVSYDLTVTNRQAFSDSFAITYNDVAGWTVGLYDSAMAPLTDTDSDGKVDTGTLAPSGKADIKVTVTIPASPSVNQIVTTVNASSFANPLILNNCTLTTQALYGWLMPPHSDSGYDNDGDGLYNYLVVNASLYVRVAGWYYVYGWIYTPSDSALSWEGNSSYFDAGQNYLELWYHGWYISNSGENGPYHVDIDMYSSSTGLVDSGVHFTNAYSVDSFMLQPAVWNPPFSDSCVDSDGDGLFEYMVVDVNVTVNYAGRFEFTGELLDSSWSSASSASNDLVLPAGDQTIQLYYSAWDIVKHGVGGTFRAYTYMQAWVDGTLMGIGSYYHVTASYPLASFEPPPAWFAGPYNDGVIDTNGDGLYDYLLVNATVNCTVAGDYVITGVISSYHGEFDTVTNATHLDAGLQVVQLAFPGWPINYDGAVDNFDVDMTIKTGSTVLDTYTYSTALYWHDDFQTAPGKFDPPHVDYGLDTNGDTLYDYLVVDVAVNVTMAGTYEVHAHLRDSWWSIVDEKTNRTSLLEGNNTVEMRFTGWMIRDNGVAGPFTVLLWLYDDDGRLMDTGTNSTAAYASTSFAPAPAQVVGPLEYYAVDADGDGLYDTLVGNVTINVATAGTFLVYGYLYDGAWATVSIKGLWAQLDVGTSVVQVSFPGWLVYANGYNGTYWIYGYVSDSDRNNLGSLSISTSAFNFDQFNSTVPRIDSKWSATSPTIDGSFGGTEWAGAVSIDLATMNAMNLLEGKMYVMNNATHLFIAFDAYGDVTQDFSDLSSIAFDTGNDDKLTDGKEDMFLLSEGYLGSQMHSVYSSTWLSWSAHCQPFDVHSLNHEGLSGAVGFGTSSGHPTEHRIYEYSIPLALIGVSPGQTTGFLGRSALYQGIWDAHASAGSSWPTVYGSQPEINQYGELHLAQPTVTTPPTTVASVSGTPGSSGWYVSSVTVSLSATGGVGGLNYTEYRLDGGAWTRYTAQLMFTTSGTYPLEFRSVDNTMQTESTKTLLVKIDMEPPTTTAQVDHVRVTLNATDATSGVSSIMYRIDNGAWRVYTGTVSVIGAGTHTLEYYSVDAAGNREATKSVEVKGESTGGGISSSAVMLIGAIAAAIVAALVIIMLLMKRRKGQAPVAMVPAPGEIMPPAQGPSGPS